VVKAFPVRRKTRLTVFAGSVSAVMPLTPSTIALTEGSKNFSSWSLEWDRIQLTARGCHNSPGHAELPILYVATWIGIPWGTKFYVLGFTVV
jgi:hypothetical protein